MLLPPRFELVLVVFLNKGAMILTVALLTPGLGQRTCCPSLNDDVSQHMHFKRQLPRFAHLESSRVHFKTIEN